MPNLSALGRIMLSAPMDSDVVRVLNESKLEVVWFQDQDIIWMDQADAMVKSFSLQIRPFILLDTISCDSGSVMFKKFSIQNNLDFPVGWIAAFKNTRDFDGGPIVRRGLTFDEKFSVIDLFGVDTFRESRYMHSTAATCSYLKNSVLDKSLSE